MQVLCYMLDTMGAEAVLQTRVGTAIANVKGIAYFDGSAETRREVV